MAKDDNKGDGKADGGEEKEKKSGGGILPLINTVLLVLAIGVGGFNAWTLMNMKKQTATPAAVKPTAETAIPEAEDDSDAKLVEMDMDNITVNLADPNRFLRLKIRLALRNEEAQSKIEARKAELNDLIITAISGKSFDDIRTPQGKWELKEELVHRINKAIGGHPVRKLFFTDFVSQ